MVFGLIFTTHLNSNLFSPFFFSLLPLLHYFFLFPFFTFLSFFLLFSLFFTHNPHLLSFLLFIFFLFSSFFFSFFSFLFFPTHLLPTPPLPYHYWWCYYQFQWPTNALSRLFFPLSSLFFFPFSPIATTTHHTSSSMDT